MVEDEDSPSRLSRSLSARFRRKEQVARGEQVAETREEEEAARAAADQPVAAESEEDAALDDDQLLRKYGLTDPEEIEDEAGLEAFMENGLPDRLRQMALRRMWRLNPLFRFADEMVEYGENYTDAATVIDGMTTAYQVGKGYLQKTLDALDEEAPDADIPEARTGQGDLDPAGTPPETGDSEETPSELATAESKNEGPSKEADPADTGRLGVSEAAGGIAQTDDSDPSAAPARSDDDSSDAPPPRPRRMTFRKPLP
ncbi:MAG: DUF3306 domain-containing protein [Candidatus Puniceispirillaceae bacterium]